MYMVLSMGLSNFLFINQILGYDVYKLYQFTGCNMLPWSTQKPRAGTRLAYAQAKIFPIAPGFTLLKNLLSGPGSHTVQYTLR